jgi:hypothetical protein
MHALPPPAHLPPLAGEENLRPSVDDPPCHWGHFSHTSLQADMSHRDAEYGYYSDEERTDGGQAMQTEPTVANGASTVTRSDVAPRALHHAPASPRDARSLDPPSDVRAFNALGTYVHQTQRTARIRATRQNGGAAAKAKIELRASLMPYFRTRFAQASADAVVDTPSGTVRVRFKPDHRAVSSVTPARIESVRLALTPARLRATGAVSVLAALEQACCEALEEVCAPRHPHLMVSIVDGRPHEIPRITVPSEVMSALRTYHETESAVPRASAADKNLHSAQKRDCAHHERNAIECLRAMPGWTAEVVDVGGGAVRLVLKDTPTKGGSVPLATAKPLVAETLRRAVFATTDVSQLVSNASDRDLQTAIFLAATALDAAVRAHGKGTITSRIKLVKIATPTVGGRGARAREARARKEAALDAALAPYLDACSAAEVPVEVWQSLLPKPCECGARASFGEAGDAMMQKRWCGACRPPAAIKL